MMTSINPDGVQTKGLASKGQVIKGMVVRELMMVVGDQLSSRTVEEEVARQVIGLLEAGTILGLPLLLQCRVWTWRKKRRKDIWSFVRAQGSHTSSPDPWFQSDALLLQWKDCAAAAATTNFNTWISQGGLRRINRFRLSTLKETGTICCFVMALVCQLINSTWLRMVNKLGNVHNSRLILWCEKITWDKSCIFELLWWSYSQ